MNSVKTRPAHNTKKSQQTGYRRLASGSTPDIFTEIYEDSIHIAAWRRNLPDTLKNSLVAFVKANPAYRLSVALSPDNAYETLKNSMGASAVPELCEDIAALVDMFCVLFGLERAGVRLGVLKNAMCPRFHVDRIPCRLVTTYQGAATEWLPHELADRSKLGHASEGKPDHQSGLFQSIADVQQLNTGDVALLKGDLWEGNEGNGLVHRSPATAVNGGRLFLTIDFIN